MKMNTQKPELLAPAGNFEKLEIAIHYGADAVYLANTSFSLRNYSGNFTLAEMESAVAYAHQQNVKVYVACNIYPRNSEQTAIAEYFKALNQIGPDAVIIADPGIFLQARKIMGPIDIHLSTQANTTSENAVAFWEQMGIKRVNVARELPLADIKEIATKRNVEIEAFVHGALCISYSGRCLLSTFLSQRDSNRGMCSHPCRWKYYLMEELRPGEYLPFSEDDRGSYVFNSKDLCMIEHIPEMIAAGISSFKIEGRMKGVNYLASAVSVYRQAIDRYWANPETYRVDNAWLKELNSINNRGYCTGFYLEDASQLMTVLNKSKPITEHRFIAKITHQKDNHSVIHVRNKIFKGDSVEVITRKGEAQLDRIRHIEDMKGKELSFAQPNMTVAVVLDNKYCENDLIRRLEFFV